MSMMDMTSLAIRAATAMDIPSIVGVRLAALTDEEIRGFSAPEFATFSSTERLEAVWSRRNRLKDGYGVYVAETEGKLVGFIVFKTERDCTHIDNIVVSKEEQGKGIGRALLQFAEKMTESEGCLLMKTDTTENSAGVPWRSYGFWARMGYKDTGERLPTNYDFKEIPLIKRLK